jgi:hypothetical protein
MTAPRAQSYTHLMALLRGVGPAKLQQDEQDRIRSAADTLLFSPEWDGSVEAALDDIEDLTIRLVDSGRWEVESADQLGRAVADCAPEPVALAV